MTGESCRGRYLSDGTDGKRTGGCRRGIGFIEGKNNRIEGGGKEIGITKISWNETKKELLTEKI